jgi:Mn-dependent DtxR family transcriptional regulator
MDCQHLLFSEKQSEKRMARTLKILPIEVLKKILCFSLYLLGAKRKSIADLMGISPESVKTGISKVMKHGLSGFRDRRKAEEKFIPQPLLPPEKLENTVLVEERFCSVVFGGTGKKIQILRDHKVHLRTILLTLLGTGLLSIRNVAEALNITPAHCREISGKLMAEGVSNVLIDKRKGQIRDFRFRASAKAALIENFAARAVTGHPVSSQALAEIINKDTSQTSIISPRTVRWHMNKLGLMSIKKTLPELVNNLKKTPDLA